jgi:hypothetical protein
MQNAIYEGVSRRTLCNISRGLYLLLQTSPYSYRTGKEVIRIADSWERAPESGVWVTVPHLHSPVFFLDCLNFNLNVNRFWPKGDDITKRTSRVLHI